MVAALGTTLFSASAFAQVMNPDPDVFDGTKTKKGQAIKQDENSKTDDWEGDNLIVYDGQEQGSTNGGLGRSGESKAGMDIGVQGGQQSSMGMPIPMGGGSSGGQQSSSSPMPTMPQGGGSAGAESSDNSGMIPQGAQGSQGGQGGEAGAEGSQGQGAGGEQGEGAGGEQGSEGGQGGAGGENTEGLSTKGAVKPGDVAIGDNSQKIKGSTVAGNGDAGQAPSEEGGKGNQSTQDGGKSANVGGSGGGGQSGKRGSGVEKGDAMPSDM